MVSHETIWHKRRGWAQRTDRSSNLLVIVHVCAVHAVTIPAGTGVNADVFPFPGPEAVQNQIVEVDERLQQVGACPWITRVTLRCQATFGEVDADAFGTGVEAASDVPLTLINEVVDERCFRVIGDFACGM